MRERCYIIVRTVKKPAESTFDEMDFLCEAFNLCDRHLHNEKDNLSASIFKAIIRASYNSHGVSSGDLLRGKGVTQAAITYHLNRLVSLGLIEKRGREYYLRGKTLAESVSTIEEEIKEAFRVIKEIAQRIDERYERLQISGNATHFKTSRSQSSQRFQEKTIPVQ